MDDPKRWFLRTGNVLLRLLTVTSDRFIYISRLVVSFSLHTSNMCVMLFKNANGILAWNKKKIQLAKNYRHRNKSSDTYKKNRHNT